ncbi:MAG TPA: hypothetical protein O0X39_01805 [Methanocorpusculum sp.]|nr:hypothetical protein [Methanocorpusculum sp.]
MNLIHKEELTGDDLNSYMQIFSVLKTEPRGDGVYIEVLEYVKNLKDLEFDRFDISAVVSGDSVSDYVRNKKYGLYFGDEDTPHIIFDQTKPGRIFVNAGEVVSEAPVAELLKLV